MTDLLRNFFGGARGALRGTLLGTAAGLVTPEGQAMLLSLGLPNLLLPILTAGIAGAIRNKRAEDA